MYKAVVQAVSMYGSENWVVTYKMMSVLEDFNHRIAIWLEGMTVHRGDGREWEWVLVEAALEAIWIWLMREYVRRRQETIAEYSLRAV